MARSFKRLSLSGLAAALLVLSPTIAEAQTACASRADIVSELTQHFQEVPEAIGITLDGLLIEVFVSEAKTWTIVITSPKGISCIASAGEDWERSIHKPEAGI